MCATHATQHDTSHTHARAHTCAVVLHVSFANVRLLTAVMLRVLHTPALRCFVYSVQAKRESESRSGAAAAAVASARVAVRPPNPRSVEYPAVHSLLLGTEHPINTEIS